MAQIKVRFGGAIRKLEVVDTDCKHRPCLRPHDCPVQGAGGVKASRPRWVCLTNFHEGCPEPLPEPVLAAGQRSEGGGKR